MKRHLRLGLALISLALTLGGCALLGNAFTFINNSSHDLRITPSSQSWSAFDLAAGNRHTVYISDETITFLYDNTDSIYCDTKSTAGTIIFTDAPTVTYRVTGTSTDVDIMYVNETGEQVWLNVTSLPWSYSFTGHAGDSIAVFATDFSSSGTMTATIYMNDVVLLTSTSTYNAYVQGIL
jgi:hypothetical protein